MGTCRGREVLLLPRPRRAATPLFCAGSSMADMSPDKEPIVVLGGALTSCCCCAAAEAFMVPSGPYLRGLPLFRLTGSAGTVPGAGGPDTETVPEAEPPPMLLALLLLCINGGGVGSIWNCMPARDPPPMELRIAVALMFMLGMGRMTECIPARWEEGLCCPPPPPSAAARCCCCWP